MMDEIRFRANIRSDLSSLPSGKIIESGSGLLEIQADGRISGIKAEWLGFLVDEDLRWSYGVVVSVDETGNNFVFRPEENAKQSGFKNGDTIFYFDSYWGERIEMVLDRDSGWVEKKFGPTKALQVGNMIRKLKDGEIPPEGATVVEGGWDHEHCEMCMETLDEKSESGFQNKYGHWMCRVCFTAYYENASLGFLE